MPSKMLHRIIPSPTPSPFAKMLLFLMLAATIVASSASDNPVCPSTCGNMSIPYPFGIGAGCFRAGFEVSCDENNSSFTPHLSHLSSNYEILDILLATGQVRIKMDIYASSCYRRNQMMASTRGPTDLTGTPYLFSDSSNKFVGVGCDILAFVRSRSSKITGGCMSICANGSDFSSGQCLDGVSCCQSSIPKRMNYFDASLQPINNRTSNSTTNYTCSYLLLAENDWIEKYQSRFNGDTSFWSGSSPTVALDWAIRDKQRCQEAPGSSACRSDKSVCIDSSNGPGYICNCTSGYEGNPYLEDGCRDVNECAHPERYHCYGICVNLPGSYICTCPEGTYGYPYQEGKCIKNKNQQRSTVIIIGVCVPLCTLILVLMSTILWRTTKKRNEGKRREKYFQKNFNLLREEQNFSDVNLAEKMKIYSLEELQKATNDFDRERMVGGGGHGQVYKGILADQRVVAIKRPKIESEDELKQYMNEVFIISQTNHRNVVKFFGCCLENEVPLLVFEFISGGTLYDHLRHNDRFSPFPFKDRLRIATEVARALSYLHSAASITIFHRDVKSSNVLLDERDTAKVADFGASRTVRLDQNSVTTVVQGTYGYLDPEYHLTGKLTDKSDVYSFGVILVELLTGRVATATHYGNDNTFRNIVIEFRNSIREDSLFKVLDPLVLKEGEKQEVERFAYLAGACLRPSGNDRPTMKQVEVELESLMSAGSGRFTWKGDNESGSNVSVPDERSRLMLDVSQEGTTSSAATRQYSFEAELKWSARYPR